MWKIWQKHWICISIISGLLGVICSLASAEFTQQEETILKAAAEKIKCEYQLKKLEKQRKAIAEQMNDEIATENIKAGVAINAIRAIYDPQIETKDAEIEAKKLELENLI